MDNFGKKVELVKMQKTENITYTHKINGAVFFGAIIYMTAIIVCLFCVFDILKFVGVVQ